MDKEAQKEYPDAWEEPARIFDAVDRLFDGMIDQQRVKVLRLAREAVPYLSPEDVLNPNDYPELKAHPTFDYEDGILAGLIAAQIALRAELRARTTPPGELRKSEH